MYELLEHSGDIKIRLRGNSFTELLENAGRALSDIILPGSQGTDIEQEISIDGKTREQQLVGFINELIFLAQTQFVLFRDFDIEQTGTGINAICRGSTMGSEDEPEYDIKGATYHDLDVRYSNGEYSAVVVLDI